MKPKTKEQILADVSGMPEEWFTEVPDATLINSEQAMKAMQQFAKQETAQLIQRIKRFEDEMDSNSTLTQKPE